MEVPGITPRIVGVEIQSRCSPVNQFDVTSRIHESLNIYKGKYREIEELTQWILPFFLGSSALIRKAIEGPDSAAAVLGLLSNLVTFENVHDPLW